MGETSSQAVPPQSNLEDWATVYNQTIPVLSDGGWAVSNTYEQDFGIPTYSLIGRDMTVRIRDGSVSNSAIDSALSEPVPQVVWDEPPAL